jgi:hypothetical protein
MSLSDNKRNVFTTIGAYTSLNQQQKTPRSTDLYPSVNNKKDSIPFLLDVLKTVAGSEALKLVVGQMLTKVVSNSEPKLKTSLKKQFIHSNSGDALPSSYASDGVTMPVKNVDITGKYKVDKSSSEGSLLYNTSSPNFDSSAHDAILNSGTDTPYNNMTINYNATSDSFNIKPHNSSSSNIGDYFGNYIDNAQILDQKEIISNTMDNIYGTLTNKRNKTTQQTYDELQIQKMLEQLLNDDDSFTISPKDYADLLQKAREMVDGVVNYDMGCGVMPAQLSYDDFKNLVSSISGSTDPFAVGNAVEATIDQSNNTATSTENKQTIKDGFFQKIIGAITMAMLLAVTTAPQIRVLLGIMSAFENNGIVLINNPKDDMKKFKTCINCMAKEIMKIVAEFIFALAILYLIKLLTPVIKKVIKEKINQYINIILSLTGTSNIASSLTG